MAAYSQTAQALICLEQYIPTKNFRASRAAKTGSNAHLRSTLEQNDLRQVFNIAYPKIQGEFKHRSQQCIEKEETDLESICGFIFQACNSTT